MKEYRSERSYVAMDEQFEMAQGSYSNIERNIRGLPYSMLKEIINDYSSNKYSIYEILEKYHNNITYQVANSNPIKLPLTPSKKLESIVPFLAPKISYVLLKKTNERIKGTIKELFDITITNSRINCRLLLHFLETFYNYTDDYPILTVKEFYAYKKRWREEIFTLELERSYRDQKWS